MKKHEEILKDAHSEENDIKFWNLFFKARREERQSVFELQLLPLLEKVTEVEQRKNGSFTFYAVKIGKLDFYPKADKILFRESNRWKPNGARILRKIFKLK